ncbi:metal-dependent hydrolase [Gracilimonas sp. Q87]|uniref:metal-dependent hydrolase n=1 Tax=Gracilimonas sp. Q87 TaxID=3384766 RepID=UPI003983DF73
MDPVTHGLVGASLSQSFADHSKFRVASLTGFVAAIFADADVFISSASDPLLNLEIHRQFTHSFVIIPFGALIVTVLLWWFVRKHLTFKEIYLFSLAGYATAGIMDYFTSYGVHLLWPFIDKRYAMDIISVFDPLFSTGVLILTVLAFYKRQKLYSGLAMIWITGYLLFGFSQHRKALNTAEQIAIRNGHYIEQMVVKPTIANQLLWSARYVSQQRIYSYGIHMNPFADPVIYKGESDSLLNWRSEFSSLKGTTLYKDIQRFSDLSDGYLIMHPDHENVIGDGRYSMLPTTLSPLWGISVDTTRPNQHVEFGTYRDANPEVRKTFIDMLMGKDSHQ